MGAQPDAADEEAGSGVEEQPLLKAPPAAARAAARPMCPAALVLAALLASVFVVYLFMPTCFPATAPRHPLAEVDDAVAALLLQTQPDTLFQLAGPGVTGQEVLQRLTSYNSYVVIATGRDKPSRCEESQPFLTVDPTVSLNAATGAVNRAAGAVEAVLGRRLFPITVSAAFLVPPARGGPVPVGRRPYAVFDLSTGELVVDRSVADAWSADNVQYLVGALGDALFAGLRQVGDLGTAAAGGIDALLPLLLTTAAAALLTAFAAAPPLWFCLACPTVLGLLMPLAINLGLGQLAGVACSRLQLDDNACFDLMLGALGMGFVLSMASAVPIFLVCRMSECAHRNEPTAPPALSLLPLRRMLLRGA